MSFFSSFLSFSSNQAEAAEVPPPYYPIPDMNRSFNLEYWWYHVETISPNQDNVTISEVRWYKEIGGLGHESLIFTVNIAEPTYLAFLDAKRTTKKDLVRIALEGNVPLQLLPKETPASMDEADKRKIRETLRKKLRDELRSIETREARDIFRPYSPNHIGMFKRKAEPHAALDTITRADIICGVAPTSRSLNARCLEILTFDKPDAPKFLLRDLAIMAREIHNYQPEYFLNEHNSYWFARTLVDIVVAMKNPTSEIPNPVHLELVGCLANDSKFGHIVGSNPTEVNELVIKIENGIREDEMRPVNVEAREHREAEARIRELENMIKERKVQLLAAGKISDLTFTTP